jgi:phage terminase large subunit-like protein
LLKYYKALESWKNVYFKWFRWSAKTTIAQMFVNYCIAYKKRRNIMWYSQTIDSAEENLTYVANSFIWDTDWWERFIRDFGNIYYPEFAIKWWQKKIKRLDKFVTENECYVRAMSLWTSPRWKNYTASDWKFRPDLLIFDDVDTVSSCQTRNKIDKAFEFMLNEVLWWTTWSTQLIFLWNTIYEDWLVPRFEEHIKNDKNREIIILPIYDNWKIVRDRFVETDDEADKLNQWITDSNKKYTSLETEKRRLWSISFGQNYLLVPYSKWWNIITRDMIRYDNDCINYWFDRIQIWVDPAISEKEWTDRFAITVCWFDWKKRYILESIWLEWNEKNIKRAWYVVKSLYDKYRADRVIVETVAYQAVLKTIFSDMWMAVSETKTSRDKVTRLLEKQSLFEDWLVYFYPDKTRELVDELLQMPNWEHDDYCDSLIFSLMDTKQKFFISAI